MVRARSLKWNPHKDRRENHGGGKVRATTRVDGEFAFPRMKSSHRFINRVANIIRGNITKQEKTCGIRMSCKGFVVVFARKNLKCGMFHRMITACCKDMREIKYIHDYI